jgi:hypothetical protein
MFYIMKRYFKFEVSGFGDEISVHKGLKILRINSWNV